MLRLLLPSLFLLCLLGIKEKKRQPNPSGCDGDMSVREVENLFTHILHLSLTLHVFPYFSKTRITPTNKQIKIGYLRLLSPVAVISSSLTDVTAATALRAQFVNVSPFHPLRCHVKTEFWEAICKGSGSWNHLEGCKQVPLPSICL